MKVKRGSKHCAAKSNVKKTCYAEISNAYSTLPAFSADPPEKIVANKKSSAPDVQVRAVPSKFRLKADRRRLRRIERAARAAGLDTLLDHHITWAEDECTALAKADNSNRKRAAVEHAHKGRTTAAPSLLQRTKNLGQAFSASVRRAAKTVIAAPHVSFAAKAKVINYNPDATPIVLTYDSGADGHYLSEKDRTKAGLPILRASTKQVSVANGDVSHGKHETVLPFAGLSKHAATADTFQDFPTSLMSVGKTADDGTISIFTKDGVTVHKEHDVLITCRGEPLLIGVRDERGRYRVPLVQQRGQWQPRRPSKRARAALGQANSVYDLPSVEQAVRWMHAVCGFPVKSTWLKAIKAGNFHGWPLLNEKNVQKYYPETAATPKGHLNQTRKNVRSTKPKPLVEVKDNRMRGKKERDIYTRVYDVRETVFSDQTGQFPKRSLSGNRYIMVMVEIDSSGILVEPLKNRTDGELIRAYEKLMGRLHRAGVQPRKHVLDNEVSESMKTLIRDKYHMQVELVPPGCHRRNAAEVAIRNFKAHFLSILAGVADDFPLYLWDRLLPQAEITINLLRQSNATPTISAYAHLNGPFDYNRMPLAPMGCNVQVHEKTDQRGTWAFHSVDGWYIGTSAEHYRVHRCHIKSTRSERLSDTVQFMHKELTNPTLTPTDKLIKALADCAAALRGTQAPIPADQLHDLRRLVAAAQRDPPTAPRVPTNETPATPRVPAPTPPAEPRRITRSMSANPTAPCAPPTPAPPRVPPPPMLPA